MASTDIDDILKVLGFGRLQLTIFFTCFTHQIYVGCEQGGIGLVSVLASCDFDMDSHRMAWLLTSIFMAQILVSNYMGYKSDTIGRRKLLLITSIITMCMSFISALMPDYWSFLVVRFMGSCFLAGPTIVLLTYLSEFTKISQRTMVLNFCSYAIGLTSIYVPASAMALNKFDKSLRNTNIYCLSSWRVLIMTNLLPGLISWIIFLYLPESPKYYLSINQPEKAWEVLEKCCRANKGKDVTLKSLGIESVTQPNVYAKNADARSNFLVNMWKDTKPLFSRRYVRQTINSIFILFMLFATGNGLTIWMPQVFRIFDSGEDNILCDSLISARQNDTSDKNEIECTLDNDKLVHLIISGCCCVCIYMVISLLLLCLNRKTILLAFMFISCGAGIMLNFMKINIVVIISFIFLTVPPLSCIRLVLSVIIDNVPTYLRSKSIALGLMFGRVGLMISNIYIGYSLQWNCFVTFNTYAVIVFLAGVLIYILPSDKKIKSGSL